MKDRTVLGLTEIILLHGKNQKEKIIARIDTGATSSSIDLKLSEKLNLGPIIKSRIVKSASGVKKRPIIKAKVNISGATMEAEFTLADRSHMTYQMLIGQNILKKANFLIDPLKEAEQ